MRTIERIIQDISKRQEELHFARVQLDEAKRTGNKKRMVMYSVQHGFLQRALRCLAAEAERVRDQI